MSEVLIIVQSHYYGNDLRESLQILGFHDASDCPWEKRQGSPRLRLVKEQLPCQPCQMSIGLLKTLYHSIVMFVECIATHHHALSHVDRGRLKTQKYKQRLRFPYS